MHHHEAESLPDLLDLDKEPESPTSSSDDGIPDAVLPSDIKQGECPRGQRRGMRKTSVATTPPTDADLGGPSGPTDADLDGPSNLNCMNLYIYVV